MSDEDVLVADWPWLRALVSCFLGDLDTYLHNWAEFHRLYPEGTDVGTLEAG